MDKKKALNVYVLVFGVIAVLVVAAAISTVIFNKNLATQNVTLKDYGPAQNFQGVSAWINSNGLSMSQLKGKVVLVDFWTYSCINCIRSIPHIEAWYRAYGNNGLVVIGVHTPEFQFEHNLTNVENAVKKFNITYPVALDNNYATWDAYGNQYWPADYLIDANGSVRYVAFGEGNYNQTEKAIRELLVAAGYKIQANLTSVPLGANFSGIQSPEMYFGYQEVAGHGSHFSGVDQLLPDQVAAYPSQAVTQENTIYLAGSWYNAPEDMVAVNNSKIFLEYDARNVNIVAVGNGTRISIKLDGKSLNQSYLGSDVHIVNGSAIAVVSGARLYDLVNGPSYGVHTLEIDAGPGFTIYTFTFG